MPQALGGLFHVAKGHQLPDGRTAHLDAIDGKWGALQHLHAIYRPMAHIVVETFLTVAAKAVVVSHHKRPHSQLSGQPAYELGGGHGSHFWCEMEHNATVHARLGQSHHLLVKGGEQLWLEVGA